MRQTSYATLGGDVLDHSRLDAFTPLARGRGWLCGRERLATDAPIVPDGFLRVECELVRRAHIAGRRWPVAGNTAIFVETSSTYYARGEYPGDPFFEGTRRGPIKVIEDTAENRDTLGISV